MPAIFNGTSKKQGRQPADDDDDDNYRKKYRLIQSISSQSKEPNKTIRILLTDMAM